MRACDLPRSTAYHLLRVMVEEGFVVHLADEARYGLGPAAHEVGGGYVAAGAAGADRPAPARRPLRRDRPERPPRGAPRPRRALRVEERAAGRPSLVTDVGVRLPAHLTATGRAVLAALPAAQVRALYPDREPSRCATAPARPRPSALRTVLAETRQRGHATEDGDVTPGFASVAAAVLDHTGSPGGGRGGHRRGARDLARAAYADAVRRTAALLTRRLGGRRGDLRRDSVVEPGDAYPEVTRVRASRCPPAASSRPLAVAATVVAGAVALRLRRRPGGRPARRLRPQVACSRPPGRCSATRSSAAPARTGGPTGTATTTPTRPPRTRSPAAARPATDAPGPDQLGRQGRQRRRGRGRPQHPGAGADDHPAAPAPRHPPADPLRDGRRLLHPRRRRRTALLPGRPTSATTSSTTPSASSSAPAASKAAEPGDDTVWTRDRETATGPRFTSGDEPLARRRAHAASC